MKRAIRQRKGKTMILVLERKGLLSIGPALPSSGAPVARHKTDKVRSERWPPSSSRQRDLLPLFKDGVGGAGCY
jgi:hypothetical protein